jgi:hypothetical protein
VLRAICTQEPALDPALSDQARDVISQLLRKNPDERLVGLEALRRHPFFEGRVCFEEVLARRVDPPLRPRLKGPEDTSAFSSYFTDEVMRYSAVGGGEGAAQGRRRGTEGGCWSGFPLDLLALQFGQVGDASVCACVIS